MSGIYIHVPFCHCKCIYCGFYSVANTQEKNSYLDALLKEMQLKKDYLQETPIRTLYFGGGTPSLLSTDEIERILKQLKTCFELDAIEEITLEANPEQLSSEYCQKLWNLGINRLSIGIQSFQDHVLRFMGRKHTAEEAMSAVQNAMEAGFQNISIDLIYGVSERTDEQWEADMETAFSLPIQHLSCYALTPEENSILYKQIQNQRHAPVDEEQATRQYQMLINAAHRTDLEHYEISNFAKPGFESKHNSSYWNHTPYLGLGPAAHSFNGNSRQWNPSNLHQYIKNISENVGHEDMEELSDTDLFNETILLSLRTSKGLDLRLVSAKYGKKQFFQLERPPRQGRRRNAERNQQRRR